MIFRANISLDMFYLQDEAFLTIAGIAYTTKR